MEYWRIKKKDYIPPTISKHNFDENKKLVNNIRAIKALCISLVDPKSTNFMDLETLHEIWVKSESLHEGDSYMKKEKIKSSKGMLKYLKMNNDENRNSFN